MTVNSTFLGFFRADSLDDAALQMTCLVHSTDMPPFPQRPDCYKWFPYGFSNFPSGSNVDLYNKAHTRYDQLSAIQDSQNQYIELMKNSTNIGDMLYKYVFTIPPEWKE